MIRLIATDLDGTLLLPDGSLPEETFPLIRKLTDAGILFAVASGRQCESLRRLFAPVLDDVLLIAENGALVIYKGIRIFCESMPKQTAMHALSAVREEDGAYPLLCCADCAYAEDDYPPFRAQYEKYYPHAKKIQTLEDSPEWDSICKIAVFDERGSAAHSGRTLKELLPDVRVVVSGNVWSDISMPETDKGKAMNFAQRYFSLTKDECAAFGDYMNDLELLLSCGHPYVTENGFPLLKERIGNIVPSNAEKGVIRKISEILGGCCL